MVLMEWVGGCTGSGYNFLQINIHSLRASMIMFAPFAPNYNIWSQEQTIQWNNELS